MSKEKKVVTKIKGSLVHGNEGQLGTKRDDECYTSMQDIMAELSYWAAKDKFRNKNIICPCDWDITDSEEIYSITITYKTNDIEVVGNNVYKSVDTVTYDLWSNDIIPVVTHITLKEDEIEDFLRNKLTCNFVRTLTQNARRWGIKSITASGFNPATGKGVPFQKVDYSKYDVCITNPPFSLFREFLDLVVGNIDFIVLSPLTNRAALGTVVPLMEKKAYLGVGVHLALNFYNPTKANAYHTKSVGCDWLTSWPEAQQDRNNKHFSSGIKYEDYKDEYVEMTRMVMRDGSHPIRVPAQFPEDYNGWMFAGINVLDFLDQDEYEWYSTNCYKYFNQTHPEKNPMKHNFFSDMYVCPDGKRAFSGILFRRKQKDNK